MEVSWQKAAMVAGVAIPVALAAAWGWSRIGGRERMRDLRAGIEAIGYARGGALPTEEDVHAQVLALAAEREVELEGLSVTSHEERGLGGAARLAAGAGVDLSAIAQGTMRVYQIRATARTRVGLFAREEAIEVRRELRASAELAPQLRPRALPPPPE